VSLRDGFARKMDKMKSLMLADVRRRLRRDHDSDVRFLRWERHQVRELWVYASHGLSGLGVRRNEGDECKETNSIESLEAVRASYVHGGSDKTTWTGRVWKHIHRTRGTKEV
jgi:hypothetical protein